MWGVKETNLRGERVIWHMLENCSNCQARKVCRRSKKYRNAKNCAAKKCGHGTEFYFCSEEFYFCSRILFLLSRVLFLLSIRKSVLVDGIDCSKGIWLQQTNTIAAQSFPCDQHTNMSALMTALTATKKSNCWTKFSVCSAYGFVCSQTILTATNKSDCWAIFSVCLAYGIICWQTMPYAGQNKILHQRIMLPSIRIWVLGDHYWCSTSILYWVIRGETSDVVVATTGGPLETRRPFA